jgi:hypothetical protein
MSDRRPTGDVGQVTGVCGPAAAPLTPQGGIVGRGTGHPGPVAWSRSCAGSVALVTRSVLQREAWRQAAR